MIIRMTLPQDDKQAPRWFDGETLLNPQILGPYLVIAKQPVVFTILYSKVYRSWAYPLLLGKEKVWEIFSFNTKSSISFSRGFDTTYTLSIERDILESISPIDYLNLIIERCQEFSVREFSFSQIEESLGKLKSFDD